MKTNTDRVVDYVLEHAKDLSGAKITGLAEVIKSLGGDIEPPAPNQVEENDDFNLADEQAPIDLSKIKKLQVDGREQPIKIYSNN